jgi:hypothetical protein
MQRRASVTSRKAGRARPLPYGSQRNYAGARATGLREINKERPANAGKTLHYMSLILAPP